MEGAFLYLSPSVIREISQRKDVILPKKLLLGNVCWIDSMTTQPCESQGCLWCLFLPHVTPAGMLSIPHSDAFNLHMETPREVVEEPGTGLTLGPASALASFQARNFPMNTGAGAVKLLGAAK